MEIIAPCGMNCALCLAFQREKNHCPGCNGPDTGKQKSCLSCSIKRCEKLADAESGFCYSCETFPCKRLKQLDRRYRTNYGMSMIANLQTIRSAGIGEFTAMQVQKWTCTKCGGLLCVHRQDCLHCGNKNNAFPDRGV